jgi:outer membrane lipase/esterase
MGLKKAALAAATYLSLAQYAQAQNFNQLIAFGDSTTDTGWFAHAPTGSGFAAAIFDGFIKNSLANEGNAHFTGPGPGNAQILGSFFGLSASAANTPGGTNYAIGGAFDGATLGPGFQNLFSTTYGVANPNLPGTSAQIGNYLASVNGHANPNALYLISSGGNDAFYASATFGSNAAAANVFLLSEAQALANGVAQLQQAGARFIIVADEYQPPSADANAAAYGRTVFTATWANLAAAGVKFIPADTASVIVAVEQNPFAFGITAAITSYACVPPVPFLTSGYGVTCAPTTTPNPGAPYGYLVSADATQTHLFMDGTHLTAAGQLIIADYYYSLLVAPSEISFLAETAIQTTFQTINGIQQQIDLAERLRAPGWNIWFNGNLAYFKFENSSAGFPSDPAAPVSGSLGVDYKWPSGWLAGAAVTAGYANPTFSLGGGFTQNLGSLSGYTAYYHHGWWSNLIGTIGWLGDTSSRWVPIGITMQPNNGSTTGYDLSLAGQVGYDFHFGPITHGPVGGFILQRAVINGFTESGSFTSLGFGSQLRNSEVSLLGYQARFDYGMWHPFAQVLWDHEFDPLNRVVTASLTTIAAPSYSMPAVVLGRDWATTTVGTQLTFTPAWSALASFTAQLGQQRATVYGGLLGLNYSFAQAPSVPIVVKN